MAADAPTPVLRAMRLRGVLEDGQAMGPGDRQQRIQVGRLAIEVHRDHRLGAAGDRALHKRRIEVEARCVGLDRHRHRAAGAHGQPGGDEGVGGDDDFVARPDVHGKQRQLQRRQAVGDADGVPHAAEPREFFLEGLDFRPEDVAAAGVHPFDRGVEFRLDLQVRGLEVQERDFDHGSPSARM